VNDVTPDCNTHTDSVSVGPSSATPLTCGHRPILSIALFFPIMASPQPLLAKAYGCAHVASDRVSHKSTIEERVIGSLADEAKEALFSSVSVSFLTVTYFQRIQRNNKQIAEKETETEIKREEGGRLTIPFSLCRTIHSPSVKHTLYLSSIYLSFSSVCL
jgi:hypothetical protein